MTAAVKRRVLFLCTGNSARSQMAEALTNHFLGDRWEAASAGTTPAGYVHPMAVEALAEWGIEIASLRSKSIDEFLGTAFDRVITLCDEAAEHCPVWPGKGQTLHIGFPDPARSTGSRMNRLEEFRQARDGIRERVCAVLQEETGGHGRKSASPEPVKAPAVPRA